MTWPALVGIAVLPIIALKVGSWIIIALTDRREILARIKRLPEKKHLNQRVLGYDVSAVRSLWGSLKCEPCSDGKPSLLDREQAALRLDLLFPVLYGAALAASLLLTWRSWKGTAGLWLLAPVVIYLLADWTENAVHLRQLRIYRQVGPEALESDWVQVASRATTVKLLCFIGCQLAAVTFFALSLRNN